MASHYLISKVFPEWRLNPGFGIKKKCPFPLNRGVPSIKITNTNIYVNIFPGPNFVSLEWIGGVPFIAVFKDKRFYRTC